VNSSYVRAQRGPRDRDLEFVVTRRDLRLVAHEAARELPMARPRCRSRGGSTGSADSIFGNDTASGVVYRISTRG
jgi:hypothetical protein